MAPTILLIAGYVWFTRRQMGGLTGGGGGGRGIFNVGKAQACALCRLDPLAVLCKPLMICPAPFVDRLRLLSKPLVLCHRHGVCPS